MKVRTWKKQGNYKTVILLDGMRAEYGYSGWEINTNVQKLVNAGVNVVQPVGGPASFYADWDAPPTSTPSRSLYRSGAASSPGASSARSMPTASVWATASTPSWACPPVVVPH